MNIAVYAAVFIGLGAVSKLKALERLKIRGFEQPKDSENEAFSNLSSVLRESLEAAKRLRLSRGLSHFATALVTYNKSGFAIF